MNDKELLELAAKAAGFVNFDVSNAGVILELGSRRGAITSYWNPLTDDGDALRLAVKLRIEIAFSEYPDGEETAIAQYGKWAWREVSMEQDPHAATRRAIVLAAAQLAKNK